MNKNCSRDGPIVSVLELCGHSEIKGLEIQHSNTLSIFGHSATDYSELSILCMTLINKTKFLNDTDFSIRLMYKHSY